MEELWVCHVSGVRSENICMVSRKIPVPTKKNTVIFTVSKLRVAFAVRLIGKLPYASALYAASVRMG